ncbi:hypothetical protein ANN_02862 [Periplaneta americana]|uniref:Prokineticin domain-containing protein n=1 Tax=Periplaneta americana TaxID=6978 RepID=A0ABQ8U115_PERAM|nr:hypothetical protein ANN_02862 [Periplaneta americana]
MMTRYYVTMYHMKLVAVLIVASVALIEASPYTGACLDAKNCGASQCCVVGMQAYSIPTCNKVRGLGESCRPNNEPGDFNLSYPDGSSMQVTNAYLAVCGCAEGLLCHRGTCQAINNK